MGLSESEFWGCTSHYFVCRLNGMRTVQKQEHEIQHRRSWTQARFIALMSGNFKKGTRAQDLMRFDWEPTEYQELQSVRESLIKKNWPAVPPPKYLD